MSVNNIPVPGRDLDALIATHVLGWKYDANNGKWRVNAAMERAELPAFSTSDSVSTELTDAMKRRGFVQTSSTRHQNPTPGAEWMAGFSSTKSGTIRGDGRTEAHAVCVAALRALGAI